MFRMLALGVLLLHIGALIGHEVAVETSYGRVIGRIRQFDGRQFTQFLGIPYAAPPTGVRRFKPPQRHDGWHNANLHATDAPKACMQDPLITWTDGPQELLVSEQSEDCLYLNIYVTGNVLHVAQEPLPVVVVIHVGRRNIGSAKAAIGDAFVTQGKAVVMVAIQSRLGVFAFLTSGDKVLSGNLGLKDQVFALQWVQDNIANFGGNPNHVTIFGQSGGATAVLNHVISPMSAGLFHKAIAESPWMAWRYASKEYYGSNFRAYADWRNCSGDSEQILECLRTKPTHELQDLELRFYTLGLSETVIDGEFIRDEPMKLWLSNQVNDVPLLVGFNSDNGGFQVDGLFSNFTSNRTKDLFILVQLTDLCFAKQLSGSIKQMFHEINSKSQRLVNANDLYTVIKGRYYDSKARPLDKARSIRDYARDSTFAAMSLFVANRVASRNKTAHVYVFDHRTASFLQSKPGEVELKADSDMELPYAFGYGATHPDAYNMTDEERALAGSMIHAWTSFATGDAEYLSMDGDALNWPEYTDSERKILRFDTQMSRDSVEDGTTTWQPVLNFWLAIDNLAQFEDVDVDSSTPTMQPPMASTTQPPTTATTQSPMTLTTPSPMGTCQP